MANSPTYKPNTTPSLNRLIAEINKKAGETVISRVSEMKNLQVPRISTQIPQLDEALGGGLPRKAVIELYGQPSSGKSLISMKVIAEAQRLGLDAVLVDLEESFDPEHAEGLGIDTQKLVLAQSIPGEDMMDMLFYILRANPGVIVIDSVSSIIPRAEAEESVEKAQMALRARLLSKGIPRLVAMNRETSIIFISQMRNTMAMFGNPLDSTGGNAIKFFSSIRVEVSSGAKDRLWKDGKKSTEEVVGQIINCKVIKNKTAPPFKRASFKYLHEGKKFE